MQYTTLTAAEFDALEGLDDWRWAMGAIRATFLAPSFTAASDLVATITEASEQLVHHPDLGIRYPGHVSVLLTTHATGGLTTLDVELARRISVLAAKAGATAEPLMAQVVEWAIDTLDADRIRPFWAAVLGYVEAGGNLIDPRRVGPPLWFQQMDKARPGRSRFHVDVTVAHDIAQQRVDAALAAGGRLVTDRFARSWWVLADADGNEACVCTWLDRE